jgi:AraC family ethanolamine operon transcriptional activator
MRDELLINQTTAFAIDCSQVADWSCQAGWDIEYHQIGRGHFNSWFSVFSYEDMLLTNQFCNRDLIMTGCPSRDMVALVLPAGGTPLGVFEGDALKAHEGIVLLPGSERTLRSPPDFQVCTLSIPSRKLDRFLRLYYGQGLDQWSVSRSLAFPPETLSRLVEMVIVVMASRPVSISQFDAAALENLFLEALTEAWHSGRSNREQQKLSLRNKEKYVRLSREYIEEHLHDAISISSVAEHINITTRTLERAFQEVLGITPLHYLLSRRLNRVRQQLIDDVGKQRTIARLAYENGFCHLGNFTRYYKTLFGELPSQTLKNRKSYSY